VNRWSVMRDYRRFFSNSLVHHYRRQVAPFATRGAVTPREAFAVRDGAHVLVKMDVEGAEYELVPALVDLHERIVILVVEFHDTSVKRAEFLRLIHLLGERFVIAHLHGNNFGPLGVDGLPESLEITLISRALLPDAPSHRVRLPLDALDF